MLGLHSNRQSVY